MFENINKKYFSGEFVFGFKSILVLFPSISRQEILQVVTERCLLQPLLNLVFPTCSLMLYFTTFIRNLNIFGLGQMFCSNPTSLASGYKIVPQKANYEVGANIQVLCDSGLKLQGRKWLTCQQDGSWSASIGICMNNF